jgi:hypothetical protein
MKSPYFFEMGNIGLNYPPILQINGFENFDKVKNNFINIFLDTSNELY